MSELNDWHISLTPPDGSWAGLASIWDRKGSSLAFSNGSAYVVSWPTGEAPEIPSHLRAREAMRFPRLVRIEGFPFVHNSLCIVLGLGVPSTPAEFDLSWSDGTMTRPPPGTMQCTWG